MITTTKRMFIYPFLLAWLVLVIGLYIYISRLSYVPIVLIPNWEALAGTLGRLLPLRYTFELLASLLGMILFSLACLSFGLAILQGWGQAHLSPLTIGVTAFLTAEILLSVIFLTVISLNRLTPVFVASIILLGFLAGLPSLNAFVAYWMPRPHPSINFEGKERGILALGVTVLVLGLLLSSTRLGYDAAAEYFSHAKIMAVSQLPVFFHPEDRFVVSAFHPSILHTMLIQLFGDQSARMLSWVNGVAISLMGLALAKEMGLTRRARLWFLTFLVTTTAFVDLLGDGKIELISTAPILAAVYWMVRGMQQPSKGAFVLVGLFAGFAIISRPYNIFLVSLFIALSLLSQSLIRYRTGSAEFKDFIQSALWILPPLLALGAFHLFQNWVWLGSPIAPLTYARGLDSSDWQWQLDPQNLVIYRLLYPLIVTFSNSPQSLGNISPLVIGFLPFLLVKDVRENVHLSALLKRLTLIATLTLVMWISLSFTVLEIRYVLFLWVILLLPVAQVLESATQHMEGSIRRLLPILVIALLAAMNVRTLLISLVAYLPAEQIRLEDCHDTNLCAIIETINQPAAPGDRVFVLHAYRYYLRSDLFACSSRVEEYDVLEPLARQDAPDFWVELYRRGFRFVMFEEHLSESRYRFGELPDINTAPDWLQIKALYLSPNGTQKVYQLETISPPLLPEISCKQDSAGIWQLTSSNTARP
jgi:hypothetical protein